MYATLSCKLTINISYLCNRTAVTVNLLLTKKQHYFRFISLLFLTSLLVVYLMRERRLQLRLYLMLFLTDTNFMENFKKCLLLSICKILFNIYASVLAGQTLSICYELFNVAVNCRAPQDVTSVGVCVCVCKSVG